MVSQPYTREFYEQFQQGSRDSAKQIVPLILELVACKSVIDVGCGVGTWLSVFEDLGVSDILGVDGYYVNKEALLIAPEKFVAFDISKGFKTDRQFDLIMSLEVAEHIEGGNAENYLDSLVSLGSVVLFSAAVPFQEGQNHVNEQWPDYWVSRFEKRGFIAIDCIRPRIWQDAKIEWWYAQNILLFARKNRLDCYPNLKELSETPFSEPMAIVHPGLLHYKENKLNELKVENKYLKERLEHLLSPRYVLSNLPRKILELVTRKRTAIQKTAD